MILGLVLIPVDVLWANQNSGDRRSVQAQDYELWNTMALVAERQPEAERSISPDGNWVAYMLRYEGQPKRNEVHVKSLVGGRTYRISGASLGEFTSNGRWYVHPGYDSTMGILDLQTGEQKDFTAVGSYEVVPGTSVVISLGTRGAGESAARAKFTIVDLEDGTRKEIEGVRAYQLHEASGRVAYVIEDAEADRIEVLDVASMSATAIRVGKAGAILGSLSWSKSGDALGFIRKAVDGTKSVGLYSVSAGSDIHWLLFEGSAAIPTAHEPVDESLFVSDGAQWVLVSIRPKAGVVNNRRKSGVRIWNALARDLPTQSSRPSADRVLAWWPSRNQAFPVTTQGQSLALMSTGRTTALALTKSKMLLPDGYELDFTRPGKAVDVYLVDLETGQQKLLLERQASDGSHLNVSPSGRHIAYLKDGDWWIYHLDEDLHTKLGGCGGCSLVKIWAGVGAFNARLANSAYGTPGWLEDDAGFLFYDEFDIWQASLDGRRASRMTFGREKGIRYRMQSAGSRPFVLYSLSSYQDAPIDAGKDLMLSSYGISSKQSGFARWSQQQGVMDIVLDDVHVSFAAEIPSQGRFLYMRERFDLPQELVAFDPVTGRQEVIGQSNTHHSEFAWGRAELIEYQTPDDQRLQGVLYYPAGYQSDKRYPMVVDIYEHQSKTLHHYINPSRAGYDRAANFTLDGYFVFRPDIVYMFDEPGQSALRCVVAGVESVLSRGLIDPNAIGLMGHSFGGYETTFIITQTNLFAAAIAGAAITDTVSMYLSMHNNGPALFHFESQQFRMDDPFFRDQMSYLKNSPIHHAHKIATPLLAWSGTKDDAVPVAQSFEMFVALRRMGMEHILLEYPGGQHALQGDDAEDLYTRFTDWFDYHLKKKPPAGWIMGRRHMAESNNDLRVTKKVGALQSQVDSFKRDKYESR